SRTSWSAERDAAPIAATDPSGERAVAFAETDPRSRTAVMTERPPEDSITVDVADFGPDLAPPSSAPRPSSGALAASGVRGSSAESDADYEEDAPEFFDRKAIERFASPRAMPAATPSPSSAIPASTSSPLAAPGRRPLAGDLPQAAALQATAPSSAPSSVAAL